MTSIGTLLAKFANSVHNSPITPAIRQSGRVGPDRPTQPIYGPSAGPAQGKNNVLHHPKPLIRPSPCPTQPLQDHPAHIVHLWTVSTPPSLHPKPALVIIHAVSSRPPNPWPHALSLSQTACSTQNSRRTSPHCPLVRLRPRRDRSSRSPEWVKPWPACGRPTTPWAPAPRSPWPLTWSPSAYLMYQRDLPAKTTGRLSNIPGPHRTLHGT